LQDIELPEISQRVLVGGVAAVWPIVARAQSSTASTAWGRF